MRQVLKHSLFVGLMLMLILPFVQYAIDFPKVRALKGAFVVPRKPVYSFKGYLAGSFQDSMNTYLENTIGYRPELVRLHNQLQYSLFDTINAQGVIQGKEGYLFELNYIKALYGLDYVGDTAVMQDVERTAFVRNWLHEQGKDLIVVLAPGKATFFPEFVPEEFKPDAIGKRNYDEYHRLLSAQQVPVIGCNEWFLAMKDTSRYALYPKCGIHWSYYGLGVVFDSLFTTMKQLSGKDFVDFGVGNIDVTHKLRSPDRDLWEGMNILLPPDDYAMPYPKFTFENARPELMPRVITVADSYYWQWFGGGYPQRGYKTNEFWYYNKQVFIPGANAAIDRSRVDILDAVAQTDFVVLLQTDANMSRFSFGFIDDLYAVARDGGAAEMAKRAAVQQIIEGIRTSESYMQLIREKAAKRNITEEEMLQIDAGWIYEQRQKNK